MEKIMTIKEVADLIKTGTLRILESLYLKAKIKYYEGKPLMDDPTFDILEKHLEKQKSKVIKQVGSKRKDFDFAHPTPMLSLAKLQMEKIDEVTNYVEAEFEKWYKNCLSKLNMPINHPGLYYSPKFDGNAINIIYNDGILDSILTRGDGVSGKLVTERLIDRVPNKLSSNIKGVLEVRCEVVIKKNEFDKINERKKKNGEEVFANPRNYVAGILGKDDIDENIKYLDVKAISFVLNKECVNCFLFKNDFDLTFIKLKQDVDYLDYIKFIEEERENYAYQLDGVVIAFTEEYRESLGENDHDPEWAIAIKLIPDEVSSRVNGIEWNVGKTGELAPVLLIEPVELAGTIVKRISGYNAGYIIQNKLGNGAIVSVAKAGDIIPEVQSIIKTGDIPIIPQACPVCSTNLILDDIHLTCPNDICPGKMKKRFDSAAKMLDLKGVGPAVMERFSEDFTTMADLISWVRINGDSKEIEKFGFEHGSRSHTIFMNAFNKLEELSYAKVILLLGYDNVGLKLADQVAREHFGLTPNYSGHDRSLVSLLNEQETKTSITNAVNKLIASGIRIINPEDAKVDKNAIHIVMTGSPKPNWKTKEEFLSEFNGRVIDVDSLTDKKCNYLITDSYNSSSSKMSKAKKLNINILTYSDFKKQNS